MKSLKIGKNSFTKVKQVTWKRNWDKAYINANDKSKSFHILNCESLESIQIDQYSFSDFGGDFELQNLLQLQSIQIGTIGVYSYNFCYSSFVIRGIDMILNIWMMHRSSKFEIHFFRGCSFSWFLINSDWKYGMNLKEMIDVDLPSLQCIRLGYYSIWGKWTSQTCLLVMRSNK